MCDVRQQEQVETMSNSKPADTMPGEVHRDDAERQTHMRDLAARGLIGKHSPEARAAYDHGRQVGHREAIDANFETLRVLARAVADRDAMAATLTEAQARGTELLERARKAEARTFKAECLLHEAADGLTTCVACRARERIDASPVRCFECTQPEDDADPTERARAEIHASTMRKLETWSNLPRRPGEALGAEPKP